MRVAAALLCVALGCGTKEAPPPAASAGSGSAPAGSAGAGSPSAGAGSLSAGAGAPSAGAGAASAGAGSPSAGSAASEDPWAKPTSAAADAPCDDADIKRHIADSMAASLAYLSLLEKKTAAWKTDCETAKRDLLALEPDAQKFMDAMLAFKAWGEQLRDQCRIRVAELGDQSPQAADVEKRTPGLEAKVTPMLERCKNHPGFAEAAGKGLRVMHRKKP